MTDDFNALYDEWIAGQPPPFDVDRECAQAVVRLHRWIDRYVSIRLNFGRRSAGQRRRRARERGAPLVSG